MQQAQQGTAHTARCGRQTPAKHSLAKHARTRTHTLHAHSPAKHAALQRARRHGLHRALAHTDEAHAVVQAARAQPALRNLKPAPLALHARACVRVCVCMCVCMNVCVLQRASTTSRVLDGLRKAATACACACAWACRHMCACACGRARRVCVRARACLPAHASGVCAPVAGMHSTQPSPAREPW